MAIQGLSVGESLRLCQEPCTGSSVSTREDGTGWVHFASTGYPGDGRGSRTETHLRDTRKVIPSLIHRGLTHRR